MADTGPALPGQTEIKDGTGKGTGVYTGDILLQYKSDLNTNEREILKLTIDSNTGEWKVTKGLANVVWASGSPNTGLKIDRTIVVDKQPIIFFQKLDKTVKQQTLNYVLQNTNVGGSEKNKIINSNYYKGTRTTVEQQTTQGPVTGTSELSKIVINATKESIHFGTMRYPLKSNGAIDYIKFTVYESVPSKFGEGLKSESKTAVGQFQKKQYTINKGTIFLPIQPNISDSNEVEWGEDKMGLLEMIAANLSLSFTGGTALTAENVADQIESEGMKNKDDIQKAVKASVSSTLSKSSSNVVTRVTGAMLNPNMELLFKSPKLRQFAYTFKLTPRSKEEGDMVRKIIRCFKQNMAPRVAASNYFLKTPNVFDIEYFLNGNESHKGLNKIKTVALKQCGVNYTPANTYMPYTDGTMTSYEITLQFQELLPIYDEDYFDLNDLKEYENNTTTENTQIGY